MIALSKKDKKYLLLIILFSLINNLVVFPAQAAEEYSETTLFSTTIKKTIIKEPGTNVNRFEEIKSQQESNTKTIVKSFEIIQEPAVKKQEPEKEFRVVSLDEKQAIPNNKGSRFVSLTAYNSEVGQTDGDPCTTANGFNVCKHGVEDTVAANFLPFGTRIMIPALFGDRVFVVRDRMNRRFSNRVDVWMLKKSDAMKFGVRQAEVIILEN